VVRRPWAWRLLRRLTRRQFNRIAPVWDKRRTPEAFASLEAALDSIDRPPKRALDLGTGTGRAAFILARRYPEAEVVGADLAAAMLDKARELTPPELADRVRFEEADAERLRYPDGEFDLVTLANMIPFFDELARVTAPGGRVVFSFSVGPDTPIYVPPEVLEKELSKRGFSDFADFAAGDGTALVARKAGGS
jgi:ubiquinone/menaquinone biosynthesis C-methylase UbiE